MTKTTAKSKPQYPYQLERLIGKEHESIRASNQCDHRPTYQDQLDNARDSIIEMYEDGNEFIASLSEEEKSACLRYCQDFKKIHNYYNFELKAGRISNGWLVAPGYIFVIDEVRQLRSIFVK